MICRLFLKSVDSKTANLNKKIDEVSQRLTCQFPGVIFDFPDSEDYEFLRQSLQLFRDPLNLRFTSCRQSLGTFFAHLECIDNSTDSSRKVQVFWPKDLLQRKLWNLQDLRDGGGLGFTVELFFLALKQLLSTSPSQESYSALYIGTFRAITSDRRRYKHSLGTQKNPSRCSRI
jgi:hypothetical protein